jgi:hypothetical protein
MTADDLRRIETALSITLPQVYCDSMQRFPIPAFSGNDDTDVWDSADALIEENLHYRNDLRWPTHFFGLGNRYGDSVYAIDLRDPSAPVWWVDDWSFERSSTSLKSNSFAEWAATYFEELRSDLESNGIDPNRIPAKRDTETASGGNLLLWLFFAVVMLIIAARIWAWLA